VICTWELKERKRSYKSSHEDKDRGDTSEREAQAEMTAHREDRCKSMTDKGRMGSG